MRFKGAGIGEALLLFLTSKSTSSQQLNWRRELISTIYEEHEDEDEQSHPPPTISSEKSEDLQTVFLDRLRFDAMDDRERRIAQAYDQTLRWVFEENQPEQKRWSNFVEWLEGDGSLYWITGKAGSGKSTLMKFITANEIAPKTTGPPDEIDPPEPRYYKFLKKWAGRCELIVASFYFWNSGSSLQMSKEGFLQSLLSQILRQIPDMIPLVSPRRWEALCLFNERHWVWTQEELERMLRLTTEK